VTFLASYKEKWAADWPIQTVRPLWLNANNYDSTCIDGVFTFIPKTGATP
jgi:hypothetical protein